MKKAIVLLLMILLTVTLIHAQDKTTQPAQTTPLKQEVTPKSVYMPDTSKVYDIVLPGIKILEINNYIEYERRGATLSTSNDLSGAAITVIQRDASKVINAINKKFQDILSEDKKRWEADTSKRSKIQPQAVKKPTH